MLLCPQSARKLSDSLESLRRGLTGVHSAGLLGFGELAVGHRAAEVDEDEKCHFRHKGEEAEAAGDEVGPEHLRVAVLGTDVACNSLSGGGR